MSGQAADGTAGAQAARAAPEPDFPAPAGAPSPDAALPAPPPGLDRARARLDQALSRLEQATIALLARKSAMEVDRRGLTETARSLQAERGELRGFILDSAEILDSLIARAEAAMAEEPEDSLFAVDGSGPGEADEAGGDLPEDDGAAGAYARAGASMELPGLPQRRQR